MFWKIYFWFFLGLNTAEIGAVFYSNESFEIESITDAIAYITLPFGLVALFGFAYSKYFWQQWFWVALCAVTVCNEVIYGTFYAISELSGLWNNPDIPKEFLIYPAITILMFFPYYIGVTLYALKKNEWQKPIN